MTVKPSQRMPLKIKSVRLSWLSEHALANFTGAHIKGVQPPPSHHTPPTRLHPLGSTYLEVGSLGGGCLSKTSSLRLPPLLLLPSSQHLFLITVTLSLHKEKP